MGDITDYWSKLLLEAAMTQGVYYIIDDKPDHKLRHYPVSILEIAPDEVKFTLPNPPDRRKNYVKTVYIG